MAGNRSIEREFHNRCEISLRQLWERIIQVPLETQFDPPISEQIADLLRAPTGTSSTFRFVLPTQLLAKYVDPDRDARTIQKGPKMEGGSFDARSLASRVIVPFNRSLGSPLGTASDPYVNNPLRVREVSAAYRAPQRDKVRWDALSDILGSVQSANSRQFTESVLSQVLIELRRLLEEIEVRYPAPQRVSLESAMTLIRQYLVPRTGGRRLQALSVALFRAIADLWGIYDEVISGSVTVADTPGDRPADIDCKRGDVTVLAVEVKDQTLTLQLLEDKITTTRLAKVRELLFLIRAMPLISDDQVTERVKHEFSSGQSIYLLAAEPFFEQVLALVGEAGRVTFINLVGRILEEYGLDYVDRRAWATLLQSA